MADNTRGRRQGGLVPRPPAETVIASDEEILTDGDDTLYDPEDGIVLLPGDTIMAKVVHAVQIEGEDSWFTYGATSRLLPGETEEDAYYRLSATVNGRVLDLVTDSVDLMHNRREAFEAQQRQNRDERRKSRRITPQQD